MSNPRLITVGTINAGATPIQADVTFIDGTVPPTSVTLTTDYAMIEPVEGGYPARPFTIGRDQADIEYPRTITSGSTVALFACEADALINAGAAVLA